MADGDENQENKDDQINITNQNDGEIDVENAEEIQELDDIVDHCSQEYMSLNSTLDQLDCCLDMLEQRNDGLYNQLKDLLDSTRNARHELRMLNSDGTALSSSHLTEN